MTWLAIVVASLGCYATKAAGLSVPRRFLEHPRGRAVAGSLPVAILSALVLLQTFSSGDRVVVDARVAGLMAAIVAQACRAPFVAVVFAGAGATALARAIVG